MTMPTKGDIFEHWKDWLNENGFDWGEPSCWACGCWWSTKYDVQNPKASLDEIKKLWNKIAPLQRCHIIPKSLGGTNDSSNLFLMCRECHDKAPDTSSRELFLKWAKAQNWFKKGKIDIEENLDAFGMNVDEMHEFIDVMQSSKFKKWSKNNVGIHMSQKGYGLKVKISTLIAAYIEYKNKKTSNE